AWAERGVSGEERRWLRVLMIAAIALRVAAVFALFAAADHHKVPFATFFGDEDFFIKRSIWLRNLALGIPIHSADFIYAFDEVGQTSYLYFLAAIQVLVGPSPYGVHLVGMTFYLAAVVMLFRLCRRTLGRVPAFIGLTLLLFLPTLFAWSISALKESAYLLLTASAVSLVEVAVRGRTWPLRIGAAAAVVTVIAVAESVRRAGAVITSASLVTGFALYWIATRPRALIAAVVLLPIVAGVALSWPQVQVRAFQAVKLAGDQQQGHINTPGYVYKTLGDRFYISARDLADMRFFEQARFVIRSVVGYVVVPLPWQAQSKSLLAYLPEQAVWYFMVVLLPFGFVCSLRRDPLVASVLLALAVISAALVAMVSGNVGTLVRHRGGMVIPSVVWLSAVGGCELWARWHGTHTDAAPRSESTWR